MAFVRLEQVAKSFRNEKGQSTEAIASLDVSCERGELLAVIGPTGCGKTTLLRLIAGLITPDSGTVTIDGEAVRGIRPETTLVFQQYSLFPWRTVLENVAFGPEMKGVPGSERFRTAREYIELAGLAGFERAFPHELSGGMKQRTALARALASEPDLLLMDEPFGALDERTRHALQDQLLLIRKRRNLTILFVTHSIDEALYLADRVLVMRDRPGSVLREYRIELKRPRDRRSRVFTDLHLSIRDRLEDVLAGSSNGTQRSLQEQGSCT
ncbi:ABC transporter ATP-binding protein [bacterium]|nr:ABC transporter ATP-binding protein [bacterium]